MYMKKQDVILDQYYTDEDLADKLSDYIKNQDWFNAIDRIIEPSAGTGSFSRNFENCLAYDLDPKIEGIIHGDFLKQPLDYVPNTLSIGNPPFGKNGGLAMSFVKRCCEISDYVAFILPSSFSKDSFKNRVPMTHSLMHEEFIDEDSFFLADRSEYSVKCVFQVWKRGPKREKASTLKECDDFYFSNIEESDFAIRRVGWNAGRISEDVNSVSRSSHYFIKVKSKNIKHVIEKLNSIEWTIISDLTVGPRSIGMSEIIKLYLGNTFENNKTLF